MKEIALAIPRALREDPVIFSFVGTDSDGSVKVYSEVAKSDEKVPYIVFTSAIPGGNLVEPVYGDARAHIIISYAISCWGRSSQEAWKLADYVDDALEHSDLVVTPYEVMSLLLTRWPQEHPDQDSLSRQVLLNYELQLGR